MATDTGIVTIYDLTNNGAPLTTHRADAKEFLSHPLGRWSTSPTKKEDSVLGAKGKKTKEDSGEAMRLKSMKNKELQAMAAKAQIPNWESMKKDEIVVALLALVEV